MRHKHRRRHRKPEPATLSIPREPDWLCPCGKTNDYLRTACYSCHKGREQWIHRQGEYVLARHGPDGLLHPVTPASPTLE